MRPAIDPDEVDDNEDLDSTVEPEWGPEAHEVHDLDDDDDDDDHASLKLPTSRKYTEREEARGRRTKRKQDVQATIAGVRRLTESKMAKKSRSPSASRGQSTSKSRSPLQALHALLFLKEVVMMTILLGHKHLQVLVEKKLVLFGTI